MANNKSSSKGELVAIYRLEFYKNKKKWKFCKNERPLKKDVPSKQRLNETYRVEDHSPPVVDLPEPLNDAFLETDSDENVKEEPKPNPPTPSTRRWRNTILDMKLPPDEFDWAIPDVKAEQGWEPTIEPVRSYEDQWGERWHGVQRWGDNMQCVEQVYASELCVSGVQRSRLPVFAGWPTYTQPQADQHMLREFIQCGQHLVTKPSVVDAIRQQIDDVGQLGQQIGHLGQSERLGQQIGQFGQSERLGQQIGQLEQCERLGQRIGQLEQCQRLGQQTGQLGQCERLGQQIGQFGQSERLGQEIGQLGQSEPRLGQCNGHLDYKEQSGTNVGQPGQNNGQLGRNLQLGHNFGQNITQLGQNEGQLGYNVEKWNGNGDIFGHAQILRQNTQILDYNLKQSQNFRTEHPELNQNLYKNNNKSQVIDENLRCDVHGEMGVRNKWEERDCCELGRGAGEGVADPCVGDEFVAGAVAVLAEAEGWLTGDMKHFYLESSFGEAPCSCCDASLSGDSTAFVRGAHVRPHSSEIELAVDTPCECAAASLRVLSLPALRAQLYAHCAAARRVLRELAHRGHHYRESGLSHDATLDSLPTRDTQPGRGRGRRLISK